MRPLSAELGHVLGLLKDEVGETAYRSWLRSLRLERIDDGEAIVAAPTGFLRNWVETHYADRLLALWRAENPLIERLSLVVDAAIAAVPDTAPAGTSADPAETGGSPEIAPEIADDRWQLSGGLDPRFSFENFIVGKPNELAHAAARRVAEGCAGPSHSVPFNP